MIKCISDFFVFLLCLYGFFSFLTGCSGSASQKRSYSGSAAVHINPDTSEKMQEAGATEGQSDDGTKEDKSAEAEGGGSEKADGSGGGSSVASGNQLASGEAQQKTAVAGTSGTVSREEAKKKIAEKETGSLSLAQQCTLYGSDWVFDTNRQQCYEKTESSQKSGEDLCQSKGEGWSFLRETGQCVLLTGEKKSPEQACTEKGSGWFFDAEKKICYQRLDGTITPLDEACKDYAVKSAAESSYVFDKETGLCKVYGKAQSAETFCQNIWKGVWQKKEKKCLLTDGQTTAPDNPSFYHPPGDEEYRIPGPEDGEVRAAVTDADPQILCQSREGHFIYQVATKSCVSIQDVRDEEKTCSELGSGWHIQEQKDGSVCIQVTQNLPPVDVCTQEDKECLYNPETGGWTVQPPILTAADLCLDRGPEWLWSPERKLCLPADKADGIVSLGNGVYQDADGNIYRNVLNLGAGEAVGDYWGIELLDYKCDDRESWLPRLAEGYVMEPVFWLDFASSVDKVRRHYGDGWIWDRRYKDSAYAKVCAGQPQRDDRSLECPEGFMVESVAFQGNLLNGKRTINFVKIRCRNFDRRIQGLKAGYSNEDSTLRTTQCAAVGEVPTGFRLTRKEFLNNFEAECSPLSVEQLVLSGDPVSLDKALMTGDSAFQHDEIGDLTEDIHCNSGQGYSDRVLTGLRIQAQRLSGSYGKPERLVNKQEWVVYGIQAVCGTLSRNAVLLNGKD
ncbi:MAG: hypothetical protein H6618_01015 [Deltaproteobacteria bacterium]|nr:hypothetical protein [Deltaproteobacteria bacterium]